MYGSSSFFTSSPTLNEKSLNVDSLASLNHIYTLLISIINKSKHIFLYLLDFGVSFMNCLLVLLSIFY